MSAFTLSKTWQVLGPFPIGTREQDFGADPLENYGKCVCVYKVPPPLSLVPTVLVEGLSNTLDTVNGL